MTMLQPTPVVPSNAPLHHQESYTRSSRVLQEHSGNRQQDYYASSVDQKYPASYLTENTYPAYQQVPRPLHTNTHSLLQQNRLRHPQQRFHHGQRDPQQIRKEARYLFHRFRSSDGYMKYRNRQHKDDKGASEQKWPDRLEYAFFEALVNWPPMGRRKLPHKDKQRGRNELIADYIEEHTGEARTRKQVSSHIQVLKPFVESDPHIMRYLSKEDLTGHSHRYYYQGGGHYPVGGRRASQYPATAPGTYSTRSSIAAGAPSMETANLYHTLPQIKQSLSVFQPVAFEMFVQQKTPGIEPERLHTYTKNLPAPLKDDLHPTWDEFASNFPRLASIHSSRPIDCNVLFAEASIAFPNGSWRDKPYVELGISLSCSSQQLPHDSVVFCYNKFYEKGVLWKDPKPPKEPKDIYKQLRVPWDGWVVEEDGSMTLETSMKFGSTFWAMKLGGLASKVNNPAGLSLEESDGMGMGAREGRDLVDQELRDTSALQEIVIKMPDGTAQRLLLIYWKFRLSRAEEGRAYWRQLSVPTPDLTKAEVTQATVYGAEYTEAAAPYMDLKSERVDSVYEYPGFQAYGAEAYGSTTQQQPAALQSPFKYETSSSSNSALNSAVWSSSNDFDTNDGTNTAPNSAVDLFPPDGDNSFDFTGGNINISYDNMDFSAFDASAFDFGASATADFATDPALENYGTQEYSHHDFDTQWYEGFDGSQQHHLPQSQTPAPQAPMSAGATIENGDVHSSSEQHDPYSFNLDAPATCGVESQSTTVTFQDYSITPYDESQQYSQTYGISPHGSQQANGGAGQDAVIKDEDALEALADASGYMAHMGQHNQDDHQQHSQHDVVQTRQGSEGYDIYDFQHQQYHAS
ncbi:hypothetical protein CKM354_000605900 [Cercospora kikuchii]|uniref:TEA domain-containing protein n=1 Tax=Cercospora kikuchii TaxID=84275 RepID=A0A9P3CNA6_9PEZI|nr:uncharacterized protein CKM354_000605900 [Cercospora kikuchii]GIZ42805.1 hypothetical protein CKM354_000605900 [Cercospora kikuchii]